MVTLYNHLPHIAISKLLDNRGVLFDPAVVDVFLEHISIYPLGSLVTLSTGETGVIINVRKNSSIYPIVQVYFNRVNRPLSKPKLINLQEKADVYVQKILK